MKAWYVQAPFQFDMRDVQLDETGENEVLIRVRACGICGTDMTSMKVTARQWEPVGHEIAGIVEKTGPGVTHVKVGDTVVLETSTYSRDSEFSRNGRYDLDNTGPSFWGKHASMGFSEYVLAPKECVVAYEGLSFAVASLTEPLGVAVDLVETVGIGLNDTVLVVGLGPIGLMALRLAKLKGAKKIYAAARSHSTDRIALARQFGADEIILTDVTALDDFAFPQGGVDKILVTAPPQTIPSALKAARTGGIIGFIGIEYGSGATVSFDANEFHFKKLQLRASHASPALYFPMSIDLLKSGAVDGDALISHTFGLEGFADAVRTLHEDRGSAAKMVMVIEER